MGARGGGAFQGQLARDFDPPAYSEFDPQPYKNGLSGKDPQGYGAQGSEGNTAHIDKDRNLYNRNPDGIDPQSRPKDKGGNPVDFSEIKRGNTAKNRTGSPFDGQEGFGEPKKKTLSKVVRETTGKFVKILGFAFVGHHLGLFDITDPLNRESEEEKCIRQCEEENTDTGGEKLKKCIETKCKDKGGNLIGGIVNIIIFIVIVIILFNIVKKILKKKGKVGESSNNQYDDYDYDDYDYN